MSVHAQRVDGIFGAAPGEVQGAMAGARSGVVTMTQAIVGNPERLEAAAPRFQQIGASITQLASATGSAVAVADGWQGPASEAFRAKAADIQRRIDDVAPLVESLSDIVTQAAQVARQTLEQIAQIVQAFVSAITAFYEQAKAAAAALGALAAEAIRRWLVWAIGQAAKLLAHVIQMAQRAAAVLGQIASLVQRLGTTIREAATQLIELCRALGIPEKAKDVARTLLDGAKEVGKKAWDSAEGKVKFEDKFKPDNWKKKEWGDQGDEKDPFDPQFEAKATLVEGEKAWGEHHKAEASGETMVGDTKLSGGIKGEVGDLIGEGEVFVSNKGIGAEGSLFSGVRASANGEIALADGTSIKADGSAMVGAEAEGKATIGLDGAEAKAGAFVGAKAEGSVGVEYGGIGAGVTGEAWAGAGVEADAKAKWDDGKVTFGASVGAGLGVGGKVGFEITVDVNKTVDHIKGGVSGIGNFFGL